MSAIIIDGKATAKAIRHALKAEIAELGLTPGLTTVLVGDDPASEVYVRSKGKIAKRLGFKSESIRLPAKTSQPELVEYIQRLNADKTVHGILVQLPLPAHIDEQVIIETIDPQKDVDGFHPYNVGRLSIGVPTFIPCTPLGVQKLLEAYNLDPFGKHVVIVGRSNIVGKPQALIFVQKAAWANATVTICHSRTQNIAEITRQADILVAAIGQANFITADMVKEGVIAIDVGVNRWEDGTLCGDIDFKGVAEKAYAITPVPGGVGPMTIAMLMYNTVQAAKLYR
ncbi:MAG: bifunctional methylenetetrahydrofolate dehydrogenase/methenyltetrahydrofolate cyclohydrolase FolD [Gemmatimonadetes bacterium]|nr:MAG: bifunctional methylenetetrahydrofolate dehydrogenase/methenyltetrahydrofolate cyclohydrolase FolD [Gemmatimonadota bacterium]